MEATQETHTLLPADEHNRDLVANVHPPDRVNPRPAKRYNLVVILVVIGAGTAGLVTAAGADVQPSQTLADNRPPRFIKPVQGHGQIESGDWSIAPDLCREIIVQSVEPELEFPEQGDVTAAVLLQFRDVLSAAATDLVGSPPGGPEVLRFRSR